MAFLPPPLTHSFMHLFLCVGVPSGCWLCSYDPHVLCYCSGSPSDGLTLLSSRHFLSTSLHACTARCCMSSFCEVGFFSKRPRGLFFAFFFFCCATCGNLVPQPGIEPARPKLEHEVLTTGPSGKSWTSGFDWRMVWNWASVHHVYCHCWCPGYQAWFMPVSRFLYLWNYPAQLFTSSVLLCSPPLKKSSWIKSVHLGSQKPCIQMPAQTLLSCLAFGP